MKKALSILLAMLLLFCSAQVTYAEELNNPEPEIPPEEYSNALSVSAGLTISSSGTATLRVTCIGKPGTTHISVRTYIEKWTGSGWSRVTINGASEIEDGVSASALSKVYSTTVGSGTYRVTSIFTVTLSTNEVITVYSNSVTH